MPGHVIHTLEDTLQEPVSSTVGFRDQAWGISLDSKHLNLLRHLTNLNYKIFKLKSGFTS